MFLSQLVINPKSRRARKELANRYELHRTLMNAFAETLPDDERVLYRVEDATLEPVILVQSQYAPNWTNIPRLQNAYLLYDPRVREVHSNHARATMRFRLQANPTVKRDGKRHALYAETDLMDWLARKAQQHGFSVDPTFCQLKKLGKVYGKTHQQWHAVQFDGVLRVTDTDLFDHALRYGIGSAKAFGFGLLSVPYVAA